MPVRHAWNLTPKEAVALQRELATEIRCEDDFGPIRTIAGVDVSMDRFATDGFAAIVVLSVPDLEIVEVSGVRMAIPMPYIPGLLSFREVPLVMRAWEGLKIQPDLLVVDGHGIAHPRRIGIASHVGLLLDRPAIGCGKTILVGRYADLGEARGSTAPLVDHGEVVGEAVRTKNRVNPVFVSCGHRISLPTAVRWILECGRGYRLPEPTRLAHLESNRLRRGG
ncbi:MAG TPA: deoxyribonuclease V [Oscillatoriaceae cyanobacterium]